ncbi:xanthine dehydrogenase family protein molybdopterin-binding subunit [Paenarthrobacter nitroguajacolicus]|uniref:xanthine dehydrogenase family protein molybdopterin-binding subunit n=1 Tax=Paenarthrobacter nitroguajacolicus TaxID=211146 RepID=UPI00248B9A2D|nr:xanthine dehydrogenase family protein molybdopterin-binding subunit [Paenarthrobacter nitroguajacolicus]MDI2035636.1 Aldehyde oxidoreductase molybdenum-binding subunit PaoC [Paenarthrobacter nitroguajacolicus]
MTQDSPAGGTNGKYVGRPIARIDGPAKTSGQARFAAEYSYPDLAYAALVYSTIARGRILSMETAAAKAVDGVVAVLTHENAPPMKPAGKLSPFDVSSIAISTSVNYLATDEVHWNGQPIAVVVAETHEAAQYAASLVTATYQHWHAKVDFASEVPNAIPDKGIPFMTGKADKGDAMAALATSPFTVDLEFSTPQYNHNALEPHATTAVWDGDKLTVHEGTQSLTGVQGQLAKRFGIPKDNVRVLSPFVGGGFGGKARPWAGTLLAVLAARATGRPVRLTLTREGVYHTVGGRTASTQRVALGAGTDGQLASIVHTSVSRTGYVGGMPERITEVSHETYAAPNIYLQQSSMKLDLVSNTFMRAPGEAIGSFGLESAIDELAWDMGMDPIQLRMANEPDRGPVSGKVFAHRHLREAYAVGAERFGWDQRELRAGAMRDGRWLVGMGVATAHHTAMQLTSSVTVRLNADGTVVVRCAMQEMGMGAPTVQTQIVADELGVPLEAVRVEYGDTDLPWGAPAFGSVQTASVTAAVLAACTKLKQSVLTLARKQPASPFKGRKLPELDTRDAGLFFGTRGQSYVEILNAAGRNHVEVAYKPNMPAFLARTVRDVGWRPKAATGAQFCEVRVDADTGEVRVSRWLGVFDVGTVINARTAESQLRGGIIMGIGMALTERTLIDHRSGRIINPSLSEYHIPVHADVPHIDVQYLNKPEPNSPLGLLGLGEIGITGVPAAIANAVRHATGKRVLDLPITLDKVL